MRQFVTRMRSPSRSILSQKWQDRSKYSPHIGKKQVAKAMLRRNQWAINASDAEKYGVLPKINCS